jgi:CRP/FNR family transcriptional regulator, cyclic AMP receptor protein
MFRFAFNAAQSFLTRQTWFALLPSNWQARLLETCTTVSAKKGQVVMPAGSPVDGWYAVLSGLVKLESSTPDGRTSTFLGVPDGEWFGEGSALKAEGRRYSVIALRDTVLLRLPLVEFEALKTSSLAFNQYLVNHLNHRLGQAMAIIEADRSRSPEQRVALYLSGVFWGKSHRVNLSQEELGNLCGLSRQTVNKVLGAMQSEGILTLNFSQIQVLNPEALASIALLPSKA